jgi:tetratricopeptide (TPR) repeat protein
MKKRFGLLMILFVTLIVQCQAGESKEKIFIAKAAQQAAKEHKLLAIEFWAPSCNPCIGMKRDIFENTVQAEFVHKYFRVLPLSPADSVYTSLWNYFHLEYQSTVIYVDKHGNEIDRTVGYTGDRDAYITLMNDIASGKNLYAPVLKKYRRDTLNVLQCCLMARKLASRYEPEEAEKLYKRILALDPSDKHGLRAECLFKTAEMELTRSGNLKKMREFVDTASKNPFAPKAYVYLINDLLSNKDAHGCLAICEAGFNTYPDSWEILNKYAWAIYSFKKQDEYPKALRMVQKSISLNPSRPGTYSTEAWIHFEMGDKVKAIELQKKAIALFPDRGFLQDIKTFEGK